MFFFVIFSNSLFCVFLFFLSNEVFSFVSPFSSFQMRYFLLCLLCPSFYMKSFLMCSLSLSLFFYLSKKDVLLEKFSKDRTANSREIKGICEAIWNFVSSWLIDFQIILPQKVQCCFFFCHFLLPEAALQSFNLKMASRC